MIVLAALLATMRENLAEWRSLSLADLRFLHRGETRLMLVAMVGLSIILLIARLAIRPRPGRHLVVLPAVLTSLPRSRAALLVHVPQLLFLVALPFLALALADPYTALIRQEVSYPGRRIGLAIDASSSMSTPFTAASLNTRSATDSAFVTSVAAAERFVRRRINGKYHDLVGLIEFGNEAYVITPFTNDYDNILLSIGLIGDPTEFDRFPDQGTVIAQAIDVSVGLFKAFDFLDASGNLLVDLFRRRGHPGRRPRTPARRHRAGRGRSEGPRVLRQNQLRSRERGQIPDDLWIPAVEKTGGEFFAASDERSLLAAIDKIDRVAAGTIQVKEYSSRRPRYAMFALVGMFCLSASITSKLAIRTFRNSPEER